ncbi:uncharacterized protein LOC125561897 [Nematostella vectensis]|uniref:uncharacterized protein LOC125561897 n=1 Tax=Nematostella vectensis TaxID=45351 RepID=UPI0020778AEE|nr:uncharacterized protein LOC125561897 [Nematostella vectensis]
MDKVLRPERLETDPNSSTAQKEWLHWKRTFENFVQVLPQTGLDKLTVLTNFVSPTLFQHIEDCTEYDAAIEALQALYVRPRNEIFARHLLATRRQQPSESLDEYLQALKTLSKDCDFKSVTAAQYSEESIRDAFITGLQSNTIRQRLLENKTLDLKTMFDQARALESAMRSSESYGAPQIPINAALPCNSTSLSAEQPDESTVATMKLDKATCFFCGNKKHPRPKCPALEAICNKCQKKGHFAKVCKGKAVPKERVSAATWSPILATLTANPPKSLSKSCGVVNIQGLQVKALFDSGSSESYIHPSLVEQASLTVQPSSSTVSMATSSTGAIKVSGTCTVDLTYQGRRYEGLKFSVLPGLCADLILGVDFQSKHESVIFQYKGSEPPLSVCSFSTLNVDPPEPFANLTADCHPIATKSRRYSQEDSTFIDEEVKRLLNE